MKFLMETVEKMTYQEKTQNTKQSVVVLARHFQYQVEIFFQIYCSKWAFK